MSYKFQLKQGFRIGEIVIRMYENEFKTQLFDPSELDKLLREEKDFETRKRHAKQRLLDNIEGAHVFYEEVELTGKTRNMTLVDEEGLYQILMFIDTPEARRIRETFAKIIVKYRLDHKMDVYDFLEKCEKQTLKLNPYQVDLRDNIYGPAYNEVQDMKKDIIVENVLSFPTLNNEIIKDEDDDDYVDNIEYADVDETVEYLIDLDKVLDVLVNTFNVNSETILEILFDEFEVYEKNDRFYIDGNRVLLLLIAKLLSEKKELEAKELTKKSVGIMKNVLERITKGAESLKLLMKSSTIYRKIHESYPYDKQKKYQNMVDVLRNRGVSKATAEQIAKDCIKDGYTHIIVDDELYNKTLKEVYTKIKRFK